MTLPFSRDDFFTVFVRYNDSVWPAQVVLYALAVVAVVLAFRRSATASRGAHALLAALWLWMALVYHAGFFAGINRAALVFALIFVAQSGLFVMLAGRRKSVVYAPRKDLAGLAGGGLVVLGLVVYPMLSLVAGHRYPAQPTFGLPCPTTIFTFGMLIWAIDTIPRAAFVIPVIWSAIASVAAVQLGVREDMSLTLSPLVVALVWLARSTAPHAASLKSRLGAIRWS
jgi:hypothetical protein